MVLDLKFGNNVEMLIRLKSFTFSGPVRSLHLSFLLSLHMYQLNPIWHWSFRNFPYETICLYFRGLKPELKFWILSMASCLLSSKLIKLCIVWLLIVATNKKLCVGTEREQADAWNVSCGWFRKGNIAYIDFPFGHTHWSFHFYLLWLWQWTV